MKAALAGIYRVFSFLSVTFLIVVLKPCLQAQTTMSGTINTYTAVSALTANTVTVGSATGFSIGDKVLLIQMQGAQVRLDNTSSYGSVTNYVSAGLYEFGTVSSISGSVITLKDNLVNTYDTAGKLQLLRVPVYKDVTVNGTLTATAWDGSKGGVIAFLASGTVTLSAHMDASSAGFRGSTTLISNYDCYSTYNQGGGGVGESIYGSSYNATGRGARANGGGGGHHVLVGGAGGSNKGAGGSGGNADCSNFSVGGRSLEYTNTIARVFMGGGGGSGSVFVGEEILTPGARGGGIVIFKASQLVTGSGYQIKANGAAANTYGHDDVTEGGTGGGGGGGVVLMHVGTYTNALTVQVKGGKGGDMYCAVSPNCGGNTSYAPGGGGGGGIVWVNGSSITNTLTIDASGGLEGYNSWTSSSHGSVNGSTGGSLTNLTFPGNLVFFHRPTGLTCNPVSNGQIDLSWVDNSDNETAFQIERKEGAGSFSLVHTTSANATSWSNTGLPQCTQYTYRVRAYDSSTGDFSPYSEEVSVYSWPTTVPNAPSNLTATPTDNQVALSWTDNSANEFGFKIEKKQANLYSQIGSVTQNATSYTEVNVADGLAYSYRVRGTNSCGEGIAASVNVTVALRAPTNLRVQQNGSTWTELRWNDNSATETGFKIERKQGSGGTWSQITTVTGGITLYTDTGLTSGQDYYYRVRAYNSSLNSSYSNEVNGTNPDTDGDGISNSDETYRYGTNPDATDTDGDGLTDYEEIFIYRTNPLVADTDGDGVNDGTDVFPLDSTRSSLTNNPSDTTAPVITIDSPTNGANIP